MDDKFKKLKDMKEKFIKFLATKKLTQESFLKLSNTEQLKITEEFRKSLIPK